MKFTVLTVAACLAMTANALAQTPQATSKVDKTCSNIQFNGKFVSSQQKRAEIESKTQGYTYTASEITVVQKDCHLTVTESYPGYQTQYYSQPAYSNTFSFDLSGKEDMVIPESIIQANRPGGDFAMDSLRSMKIKTKLVTTTNYPGTSYAYSVPTVSVSGTVNLPKEGQNKFNVDLKFKGDLWIGGSRSGSGVTTVDYISVNHLQIRATKVTDTLLPGVIGEAFVKGVNWVTSMLDSTARMQGNEFIQLERVK